MASNSAEFQFPPIHSLPPFYTLQPVLNTRKQQSKFWCNLILEYSRFHKIHELDLLEASSSELFHNKKINRKLSLEAIQYFFKELATQGNAKFLGTDEKRVRIIWRTTEQWAEMILKFVSSKSLFNVVCSIYELRESEQVEGEEFHNLELDIFMDALRCLEKKGICAVFEGTTEDSTAVKFFA